MKYIFGPVPSRRLGLSLGVDLVPFKVCSFDCVYCECGNTTVKTLERKEYVPADEVLKEFRNVLSKGLVADYITFSGFGEPTLNVKFGFTASEIKKLTAVKLALLTNASLFWDKTVREEVAFCDYVLPSLDSAIEETFRRINRPCEGLKIEDIIEGLKAFREEYPDKKMAIEVLFVEGFNNNERELLALKDAFDYINPHEIHLNTVVRPPAESVRPVEKKFLEKAKSVLGERAVIVGEPHIERKINESKIEEAIIDTLKRRPLKASDIAELLKEDIRVVDKCIVHLKEKGIIKEVIFDGTIFYSIRGEEDEKAVDNATVNISSCGFCSGEEKGDNGDCSC